MAAPVVTQLGSAQLKVTGTTIDIVPTAVASVGQTIVVCFAINPASTATITAIDSAGNTYTQRVAAVQGSGTSGVRTVILTAPVTSALNSGAGNFIRITHPSASSIARSASAFSLTGMDNASLVDATSVTNGTGGVWTRSISTVAAETVIIAALGTEGPAGDTFENDRSYTPFQLSGTTGGNALTNITIQGGLRYFTKQNSGYIWSASGTSRLYSLAMLSLKVATGSLGPFSGQVDAPVETVVVGGTGDVADDAAIWVHPTDSSLSVVIACDKDTSGNGGLYLHNLSGARLNIARLGQAMNNIDIRYNFPLGAGSIDLVGATNQTTRDLEFFSIDPSTLTLTQVGTVATGMTTVYGFCLYRSTAGNYHAFVTADDTVGELKQFELIGSSGSVTSTGVARSITVGSLTEGLTADDANDVLYVGQEVGGVWKYSASPTGGSTRTLLDGVGNGRLTADIEGLSIYYLPEGAGYLIVTSQGSSTFAIYDRVTNGYLGSFSVVGGGGADLVTITDGIDVTNRPLGATTFASGMLVVHDSTNTGGATSNFKYVPWASIAALGGLATDATVDPRAPVTPTRFASVSSSFKPLTVYASQYVVTADREFTFEFTNSFASTIPVEGERSAAIAASFSSLGADAQAFGVFPVVNTFSSEFTGQFLGGAYAGTVSASFGSMSATASAAAVSAEPITATSAVTLTKVSGTGTATRTVPAVTATSLAVFPKISGASSGTRTLSEITASISVTLMALAGLGAASATLPTLTATSAAVLPKTTGAGSASATQPAESGDEFSYEFSSDFARNVETTNPTGASSVSLPVTTGISTAAFTLAEISATSSVTIPKASGTSSGTLTIPGRTATSGVTLPKLTETASATRTLADISGQSPVTLPKTTGSASATRTLVARTASSDVRLKPLDGVSAATRSLPGTTAASAAVLPKVSATAVATRTVPAISGTSAAILPKTTGTSAASRSTAPTRTGTAAAILKAAQQTAQGTTLASGIGGQSLSTLPKINGEIAAIRTVPEITASSVVTLPKVKSASSATRTIASNPGTSAAILPFAKSSAAGTAVLPGISGSSAVTLPKIKSTTAASRTVPARTGTSAVILPFVKSSAAATQIVPARTASSIIVLKPASQSATGQAFLPGLTAGSHVKTKQISGTATGTRLLPVRTGISHSRLKPFSASGQGFITTPERTATSTVALMALEVFGQGVSTAPPISAFSDVALPFAAVSSSGESLLPALAGTLTVTLPALSHQAAALNPLPLREGSCTVFLPVPEQVATGRYVVPGAIDLVLESWIQATFQDDAYLTATISADVYLTGVVDADDAAAA